MSGPNKPLLILDITSCVVDDEEVLTEVNTTDECVDTADDDDGGGGGGGGGGDDDGECEDLSCDAEALVMVTDEVEGKEAKEGKSMGESTSIFSSTPPPRLLDNKDLGPTDEPHEDNSLPLVVPLSSLSSGEPSLQLPPCGLSILQSSKLLWCLRKSLSSMFLKCKIGIQ